MLIILKTKTSNYYQYSYYHHRFKTPTEWSLFQHNLGKLAPEGSNHVDLNEAETMGWQWHQLHHMQIICTSFQTDNYASTSSLNFLQDDCSS